MWDVSIIRLNQQLHTCTYGKGCVLPTELSKCLTSAQVMECLRGCAKYHIYASVATVAYNNAHDIHLFNYCIYTKF